MHSEINEISIKYISAYIILFLFFVSITFSRRLILNEVIVAFSIVGIVIVLISSLFLFSSTFYVGSRFIGIFANTNSLAGMLSMLIVLLLFLRHIFKYKKLITLIMVLSVVMLLLTKSRTGIAATGFSSLLYIFLNSKKNKLAMTPLFLGLILLVVNFQFIMTTIINFTSLSTVSSEIRAFDNVDNRLPILERQLLSFSSSPLIGVGVVVDKTDRLSRFGGELSYTDILSMSGIIGISILFILIASTLRLFLQNKNDQLYFLLIVNVLLLSLFEGYLSNIGSVISFMFWILLARANSDRSVRL